MCFLLSASGETPLPLSDEQSLVRPCFRNLTPDARAKLAVWRESAATWRPQTARPQMFVRGQFFYGNERDHYIHNWYERPLHQDSSMQSANERGRMLNPLSWARTVRTAREMHLDGFAFFPGNPGCWDVVPRSVLPGSEIPLLPEFHNGDRGKGIAHCLDSLARIREMPNSFRINGRIVITCYPVMSWPEKGALDFWPELKTAAKARFGSDEFAFTPYARVFDLPDLDRPEMTGATLERTREHLREILRKTDGLFYWMRESAWAPPSLLRQPHRDIVEPLVKSVLAEPEFRGKLLGIGYWQAHENCYRVFRDVNSFGLIRLKTALEEIDRVRPDFAIGFEWDEENENTHFRPTVSNGQTTQRLMRYYTDRMGDVAPTPYPGDATDVPNLIVAYRKTLECGEEAEVQVCNVPDGTASREDFTVFFRWIGPDGKPAMEFPARKLAADGCSLVTFRCPATRLVGARILRPELTVSGGGFAERTFSDGFWPMNVEANRNLDSKWVRQALREMPSGVSGELEVSEPGPDGICAVRGRVKGPRRFRSIEVLENADTVYMHDAAHPAGRDPDRVSLSVSFYAIPSFWKEHCATGAIRVVGAPHAVLSENHPSYTRRKGMEWTAARVPGRFNFLNTHYIDLSRAEAETASLEVDLPAEMEKKSVRVSDLLRLGAVSFGIEGGGQVAFRHDLTERKIPPPPMVSEAEFTFACRPRGPLSVFRLQLIDEDCRIWRGRAVSRLRPSGKNHRFHVYDAANDCAEEVVLDTSRLVALRYGFADGARGDVWMPSRFRDMPLVGGGGVGIVNWLGCGDGYWYGHALGPIRPDLTVKEGHEITVPRRVLASDGTPALDFRKCAFATLPPEFLPRCAGYELRLRLLPRRLDGVQGLIDSGNLGIQFNLVDGVPVAFVSLGNAMMKAGKNDTAGVTVKGSVLRAGEWNDVRLVFDERNAWIETNGTKGESVPACGPQANPTCAAFGMAIRALDFFDGLLGLIEVVPR